jgi:alpha-galactosidase
VIEIDQDPLGKQGFPVSSSDEAEVWKKEMEDGSIAVGLFNLAETEQEVSGAWDSLGIKGPHRARDLWRQKDLGTVEGKVSARIGRHGVALFRLVPD